MKLLFKKLLKNALSDMVTTIAGTMAGANDLISGIAEQDLTKIIKGSGIILLGLISNTNGKK
jgi:hypothetical protein